jgi:NAD(P)H-nitrite reductase large subunit
MKLDAKRREYDIIVLGEEPHLAYNRVGLTSFFQHRKVENLYLNPQEWVSYNLLYIYIVILETNNSSTSIRAYQKVP